MSGEAVESAASGNKTSSGSVYFYRLLLSPMVSKTSSTRGMRGDEGTVSVSAVLGELLLAEKGNDVS